MLDEYQKHTPKLTSKAELKVVLQTIWDNLPQAAIDRAILAFRKRLQACIASEGRHFEHLLHQQPKWFFSELTTLRGQEKQKLNCSCIVCCVHVKLKLGGSVA